MIRIRTFLMNSIGMKFDPDPEDGAWSFVYGNSVNKTVTEYGLYVGFDTTTTISGLTYYTLLGGGAYATSEGTINFKTTKANQQVLISLSPSSLANGDYICAGKLDSDSIVNMQGKTSGTTATTVTYTVATPGNHYVKILFRNNASGTSNNNRGHARLIPFSNTVTGLNPDTLVVNMKSFSSWLVSSKPSWITLSTTADGVLDTSTIVEKGRLDLTITAAANYGAARSGNIVLRETKKGITFTIPVTLTTCPNQVILSRDYLYKNDDPSESSQITVDINGANTTWTATCTSKGSWFSISPTSGGDNATVTISWNGNQSSGASARSNVVTFTGNQGGTDQLTIYQERYICHCNCQNYCQCDIEEHCPTDYTNRCYCEMDYKCTCESKCECNNNCNECSTECHTVCYCDSECSECSTECHTVGSCNGTYTANKCLSGYGSCNGTYCSGNCLSGYGSCNGTYCSGNCLSGYNTCGCETECGSKCTGLCNSGYNTCGCETLWTCKCESVWTCKCNSVWTCNCNSSYCYLDCDTNCASGYHTCSGHDACWCDYEQCGCDTKCTCDTEGAISCYTDCYSNSCESQTDICSLESTSSTCDPVACYVCSCNHFIPCMSDGVECASYSIACSSDTSQCTINKTCQVVCKLECTGDNCNTVCNIACMTDECTCESNVDSCVTNAIYCSCNTTCGNHCGSYNTCGCETQVTCKCDSGNNTCSCDSGNDTCSCNSGYCKSDCDTNCNSQCSCNNDSYTCRADCDTNCNSQCSCHNQCSTNCVSQCSCHNQCSTNCTNVCYCDSECSECSTECHTVCYCDSDVCTCVRKCYCDNTNCVGYGYCTGEHVCPTYCTTDHKCACDNYQAPN